VTEHFDPGWLALREPYDAAARSPALAALLSAALPDRPRILDLGAGAGSLFRWLAPIIGRDQHWTLVDADPALLDLGLRVTLAWAWGNGWPADETADGLTISADTGTWRVRPLLLDLRDAPQGLPLRSADAVVCSALCDLVSRGFVLRMAAALNVPFYATLNVYGHDAWLPADPADRLVAAGFRRDQGRDKGFGRALGAEAPAALMSAFRDAGFGVFAAPSEWRSHGRCDLAMAEALIRGHSDAAAAARPARRRAAMAWRGRRLRAALSGRLAIRILHRDILAIPGRE